MSGAAIAARRLEKRFGAAVALAGVDLEIGAGRTLAVLGPNGAGKSTLLRLVAGLTRPTRGDLLLGGEPAHQRSARARIGFIGHSTQLYAQLSARENLHFAARLYGVADPAARAAALLEAEGLGAVADRPVAGFSRGMSQRVAIARGLVHDPDVVLLDEPFTGLDRRAGERLTERIEALGRAGHTVVLVTHEIEQAARVADSAVVLGRGEVTFSRDSGPLDAPALEAAYLEALDAS